MLYIWTLLYQSRSAKEGYESIESTPRPRHSFVAIVTYACDSSVGMRKHKFIEIIAPHNQSHDTSLVGSY